MFSRPHASTSGTSSALSALAFLPGKLPCAAEARWLFPFAAVAQLAEHGSSTSVVAGSNPVGRSTHSTPSSRTAASATAARLVAAVERVLGNTVISQFQAAQSDLTVLEELQALRKAA